MPKKQRLSRANFQKKVLRRVSGDLFSLSIGALPGVGGPKTACIVSKKVVRLAHDRNTVRRRCREAVRPHLARIKKSVALQFYAKRGSLEASFQEIDRDIARLVASVSA